MLHVGLSDLGKWKETLAILSTYSTQEQSATTRQRTSGAVHCRDCPALWSAQDKAGRCER